MAGKKAANNKNLEDPHLFKKLGHVLEIGPRTPRVKASRVDRKASSVGPARRLNTGRKFR